MSIPNEFLENPTPPEGTPRTVREVDELVATVPPKEEVDSLFDSLKRARPNDPMLWFSIALCLFLIVILVSQIMAIIQRGDLKDQLAKASETSECRDEVTGDLNIAKAEGILAGNEAILLLLDVLHDVVTRVPVNDEQFRADTARITAADVAAAEHARTAIENQRNVLNICKEE